MENATLNMDKVRQNDRKRYQKDKQKRLDLVKKNYHKNPEEKEEAGNL